MILQFYQLNSLTLLNLQRILPVIAINQNGFFHDIQFLYILDRLVEYKVLVCIQASKGKK